MRFPVFFHPVAERCLVNVQLAGNMRDRARSLHYHLGGFLLELRRKPPPIPGHSIPFLSKRILLDPLSGNLGAPHSELVRICVVGSGDAAVASAAVPSWA